MIGIPRLALVAVLLLGTAACAPTFSSAGLGRYDEFEPFVSRRSPTSINLELARGGYVSVVEVLVPTPSHPNGPILFQAAYPGHAGDQIRFPAGESRLRRSAPSTIAPRTCGAQQKPSLNGCRRVLTMLPGVRAMGLYRGGLHHYLLIVSDQLVDPYALAEDLFYIARENPALAQQLRGMDADLAAAALEQVLLDRPGTSSWAAHYVVAQH